MAKKKTTKKKTAKKTALKKITKTAKVKSSVKATSKVKSVSIAKSPALKGFSADLVKKLSKIRMLICDIDGVLTDSRIFWQDGQGWTRNFSVRDGYGLILLRREGVRIGVISAGSSEDVKKRMESLKIEDAYLGTVEKEEALEEILAIRNLTDEEIAYIGDDYPDVPVMKRVGFSATVPDATADIKKAAHYVTQQKGGFGAVREVADAIRGAQGLGPVV